MPSVPGSSTPLHHVHATALLALVALLAALAVPPPPARAAAAGYAERTGHTLVEPFLSAWLDRGGPDRFGLPVTESARQGTGHAQYFEYGALRVKDGTVAAVAAGRDLVRRRHDPDRRVAGRRVGSDRTTKPGASDARQLRVAYEDLGGADRFGRPLGPAYVAAGVAMRWYTYGRLEIPVGEGGPARSAPVGLELARALGFALAPVPRNGLPLLGADGRPLSLFAGDGTIPEAAGVFAPVRIAIPAIGVDAAIETTPIADGAMGIPENPWNVGWYDGLAWPGDGGNVVMAGHVNWWNIGPTVFANLAGLGGGESIYLLGADGMGATYVVAAVYAVPSSTPSTEVTASTGAETLTLITCTGSFNGTEYDSRLIVRATRV